MTGSHMRLFMSVLSCVLAGASASSCVDSSLPTTGWHLISFQCIGHAKSFDVLNPAAWKVNDKIIARDGTLEFAIFDGAGWVGNLVPKGLSSAKGYRVLYSGTPDTVLTRTGGTDPGDDNGLAPVLRPADVKLVEGWNWVGHAAPTSYDLNSGIVPVSGSFTAKDQIISRSEGVVSRATHDGSAWQGDVLELEPGKGYEIFVAEPLTFRYV